MPILLQQLAVGILIVVACAAGPAAAVAFLGFRKRHTRARRRSPIGIALLRGPGHTLREQIHDVQMDLFADAAGMVAVPLALLAVALADGHVRGVQQALGTVPLYAGSAVAFFGFMLRRLWKTGERLDQLRAGYDAEVAVGQELDQLMRQGAVVFHDFPADRFNIDHIVVSTQGVFAVETKGYTKSAAQRGKATATVGFDGKKLAFPTWTTADPLEQADRQATWLSRWLATATGDPVHVLPVLALPGWFVQRSGRGNVLVFSGRELSGLLKARNAQPLDAQHVERIVHQIEQRCRTVTPSYTGHKPPP